jgi:YD repeat-containing protein
VDADIDAGTGLPAASRDESGLETAYTFDASGRLTAVTPQGPLAEAATIYTYTNADLTRTQQDQRVVY